MHRRLAFYPANDDGGSQIMEFAISVPLLVVLVVGIYDFAQAFNVKQKLNFAVKDGARFGATQPTNDLSLSTPSSVVPRRLHVFPTRRARADAPSGQSTETFLWLA